MRKRALVISGIMVVCFVVFMVAGAFAANTGDVGVSATLAPGIELTMNLSTVNWGGASLAPGSTYTDNTLAATVNSNKAWSLQVKKLGDLTFGTATIPSANLTWTSTSTTPTKVNNLVGSDTEFQITDAATCSACDRGSGMNVTMHYKLVVPWDNDPGAYTATHRYTVTQP